MKKFKKLLHRIWHKFFGKKSPVGPLIYISAAGAPTYDPSEGRMIESQPNQDAYEKFVRYQGEVIEPLPEDTAEEIASMMSCAACDHEFPRVIVYPISGELRQNVLKLLTTKKIVEVNGIRNETPLYPMYEYFPANIVDNDSLDSQSIIYKYAGQTHECKPI